MVSGKLSAKTSARYVLRAFAGQLMEVSLSAPEGARLSVSTARGWMLTPRTEISTSFRGYLWSNGDYVIEVTSGDQPISYSVSVSIPKRINFARGATSAAITGSLAAYQSLDYILGAGAGQLMEINVSPSDSVQLVIYGADGTVLRSGMAEGSSFRGELPGTQDYLVSVRAGEQAVDFTMNVVIPSRIAFRPGAISGTAYGSLSANQSLHYVLRAMEGQTMQVDVTSGNPVQLIIYGADGTVLRSGMGEGSSFSGQLPSTQDYILVVRTGSNAASFTLKVTIP